MTLALFLTAATLWTIASFTAAPLLGRWLGRGAR